MRFLTNLLSVLILQLSFFLPAKAGSDDVSVSKSNLKILTWNIFMLPPIVPREGRIERAFGIVDTLKNSDYDIIVFQEAFHKKAVSIIDKGLKDVFPYRYGPFNPTNKALHTNSGVYIVSKIPLQELGVIKYKDAKGIDKMANKGAALMQGSFNGNAFQILGTHMQAGYTAYGETRKKQLTQIENELLKVHRKDNVPQILCGDMNVERNVKEEYAFMIKELDAEDGEIFSIQKETYDSKLNPLADPNTFTTFDYILLRRNGAKVKAFKREVNIFKRLWKKGKYHLSDHFGLTCEVIFDMVE